MSLGDGETVRIRTYCRMGDALAVNVTNWKTSMIFGSSIGDEQPVADACDTAMSVMKSVISSAAEYRGAVLDDNTPFGALVCFAGSSVNRGNGEQTGNPLPPQVCGLITRRTAESGREHSSRYFLPFLPQSFVDADGEWTDDALSSFSIVLGAINSSITTFTEGVLVVLTPIHLRRTVPDEAAFTTSSIARRPATQRRRAGYKRVNSCPFGM